MALYETSPDAEADLQDIISYTINKYGIGQMTDYITTLETCAENIAQGKGSFKKIRVRGYDIRVKHCQHHYIFGLIRNNRPMLVLAIFHERMDLMKQLSKRL